MLNNIDKSKNKNQILMDLLRTTIKLELCFVFLVVHSMFDVGRSMFIFKDSENLEKT